MHYLMHAKYVETMEVIKDRFRDEEGATAVEYGVMVALIIAIIIAIVASIGKSVSNGFATVNTNLP